MKREIIKEFISALYPDDIKCIVCGREIHPNRYGLCDKCKLEQNDNYCIRCGRHKVGIGDYCGECSHSVMYFDEARSCVNYDGEAKNIIRRLKYGNARYLVNTITEFMLDTLIAASWDFDCFTFVPMHKKRLRERGYNQAELIAKELASHTTTPCRAILEKTRATVNQARLSRDERMKNLSGVFAVTEKPPEHVLIIDDVMTTGSTVNECARVLKRGGASVVYVLTFASVPERPAKDGSEQNIKNFRR